MTAKKDAAVEQKPPRRELDRVEKALAKCLASILAREILAGRI